MVSARNDGVAVDRHADHLPQYRFTQPTQRPREVSRAQQPIHQARMRDFRAYGHRAKAHLSAFGLRAGQRAYAYDCK